MKTEKELLDAFTEQLNGETCGYSVAKTKYVLSIDCRSNDFAEYKARYYVGLPKHELLEIYPKWFVNLLIYMTKKGRN